MNKHTFQNIIIFIFIALFAFACARISDNVLQVGDLNTVVDKLLHMGNGIFKWDGTDQKLKFSNDAGVSFKAIGSGAGGSGGINLLENPDFESGILNWTASGGVFAHITSGVNLLIGEGSATIDFSATSETLDSDLELIPNGLKGRTCSTSMIYLADTISVGDVQLVVNDGTNDLITPIDLVPTSGVALQVSAVFPCPTSGSIKLRLQSTAEFKSPT